MSIAFSCPKHIKNERPAGFAAGLLEHDGTPRNCLHPWLDQINTQNVTQSHRESVDASTLQPSWSKANSLFVFDLFPDPKWTKNTEHMNWRSHDNNNHRCKSKGAHLRTCICDPFSHLCPHCSSGIFGHGFWSGIWCHTAPCVCLAHCSDANGGLDS